MWHRLLALSFNYMRANALTHCLPSIFLSVRPSVSISVWHHGTQIAKKRRKFAWHFCNKITNDEAIGRPPSWTEELVMKWQPRRPVSVALYSCNIYKFIHERQPDWTDWLTEWQSGQSEDSSAAWAAQCACPTWTTWTAREGELRAMCEGAKKRRGGQ